MSKVYQSDLSTLREELSGMYQGLRLRAATHLDCDLLLGWRNDARTRMASQHTTEVQRDDHLKWLASSLRDEKRILMVAEADNIPVGTVRADLKDGVYELSWTVAPGARGRGIGKAMVALFISQLAGDVRAQVKKENRASIRIAEFAGLQLVREERGVLLYKRGHVPPSTTQVI